MTFLFFKKGLAHGRALCYIAGVMAFFTGAVFAGCMLPVIVNDDWLERGSPMFWLGWTLATVGTLAALLLMFQL